MRGGVAALAVGVAHIGGALTRFAEQRIHYGGLAGTGRPDEGGSLPRLYAAGDSIEAPWLKSAERHYGNAGRVTLGEPNDICEVPAEICFVEQDDRTGAALMREDKIAFETARVVVA